MQEPQAHHEESPSPTQVLEDEHRVIERMLTALDTVAKILSEGGTPPAWIFADASDFIANFADECHHAKEERRMFPMLEEAGMPAERGPLSVMLADHEQGRALNKAMRMEASQLEAGNESARQELINNIQAYVALLRMHIQKEDNVLFPMAERMLTDEQQHELAEQFERVEREETGEGVHEKYLAVLERIEKELGA